MRFTDVFILMVMITFLETGVFTGLKQLYVIDEKIEMKKTEADSLKFIPESFRNCCKGKGFENLVDWQKCCKAMWNLDYISWCKADSFMEVPLVENTELLYGKWKGLAGEGEIYCRRYVY